LTGPDRGGISDLMENAATPKKPRKPTARMNWDRELPWMILYVIANNAMYSDMTGELVGELPQKMIQQDLAKYSTPGQIKGLIKRMIDLGVLAVVENDGDSSIRHRGYRIDSDALGVATGMPDKRWLERMYEVAVELVWPHATRSEVTLHLIYHEALADRAKMDREWFQDEELDSIDTLIYQTAMCEIYQTAYNDDTGPAFHYMLRDGTDEDGCPEYMPCDEQMIPANAQKWLTRYRKVNRLD
jgi:hypothetical protein